MNTTAPVLTPPPATPLAPVHVLGLEAPKVLLMGPPGTGKSYSISTLLQEGLEVFILMTEPNSLESVQLACKQRSVSTEKLHWKFISPQTGGWAAIQDLAKQINLLDFEGLSKLKGISKRDSTQLYTLLQSCQNFICDRTGENFGDVTSWDSSRALVVDSLSGLNTICLQATVGLKPSLAPGEWGVAMNMEETLINKLTSDLKCFFLLIAHIDRNQNEATLQSTITPAAIGAKLGPRIGRFFSEVVLTKKIGDRFLWSTVEPMTDTKQRILPLGGELLPSFSPLIKAHREKVSVLGVKK